MNELLSKSIQDKHTEIHYDEAVMHTPTGPKKLHYHGKISCPVLNQKISSIVCYKLMDQEGWPRCIDPTVCEEQAQCFISNSIKKHIKNKEGHSGSRGESKSRKTD